MLDQTNSAAPVAFSTSYSLDEQVGFVLRQVSQRHASIFNAGMNGEVTTTQWAALAKLNESGPLSQNLLGRLTVMDAATIKGVIDRLTHRGLTETGPDAEDRRRRVVALTQAGRELVQKLSPFALRVTEETLAPLTSDDRAQLTDLLLKLR